MALWRLLTLAPLGRWRLPVVVALAGGAVTAWVLWPEAPATSSFPATRQESTVKPAAPVVLTGSDLLRQELLANLAVLPGQPFPAGLPWVPHYQVGSKGAVPLEYLLHQQPVTFLEMCLERYEREIQSYRLTFLKRERVKGKLQPPEKVAVHYRDKPFSVHMQWLEGGRLAQKVLYVEGENQNMMLARPAGRLLGAFVVSREVDGADAKSSGRYTIRQFGLYDAMRRSVVNMRAAERRGELHIRYEGLVTLPEVGDRPCYKFVRGPYHPPEEDGINEFALYVDQETWLQVGSVLKDENGELIGEYFFRDIEINPSFAENQFQRGAV